jgi:hypothetical protein
MLEIIGFFKLKTAIDLMRHLSDSASQGRLWERIFLGKPA